MGIVSKEIEGTESWTKWVTIMGRGKEKRNGQKG